MTINSLFKNLKLAPSFYIYFQNILVFINSISIKSSYIANRYNSIYRELPTLDINDKTTWPYYINLFGNPHVLNTDIEVVLPGGYTSQLTKQTIATNQYLRNAILTSSDLYSRLLRKYPTQQTYIKGCLYNYNNQFSLQQLIDAKTYTLLGVELNYLDDQEKEIIYQYLQNFLDYYAYRWEINTFNYEELYGLLSDALLWILLPLVILYLKIQNIRTGYIDDFNLWEYLISEGLESFQVYFTKPQSLYFYRNVKFLKANKGKIFTTEKIKEVLLDPLQYKIESLFVYHYLQNSTLASNWKSSPIYTDTYKLYLHENVVRDDYNKITNTLYANKIETRKDLSYVETVKNTFNFCKINRPVTKLQQLNTSPAIDYKYYFYYLIFIFDNFIYLQQNNRLQYQIKLNDYLNKGNFIYINTKDIIALYYWIVYKTNNQTPVNLPNKYRMERALTHYLKQDALDIIPTSITYSGVEYPFPLFRNVETDILDELSFLNSDMILSKEMFTSYIETNFKVFLDLILSQRYTNDYVYTSVNKVITRHLFQEQVIEIVDSHGHTTYNEFWATRQDLKTFLLPYQDNVEYYPLLLLDIFKEICHIDENIINQFYITPDFKSYKEKLLRLFKNFNSYLVRIIEQASLEYIYQFTAFNYMYEEGTQYTDQLLYPSKGTIFKLT